ncbi:FAD-dependent monooxygenase [Flindersiella endophytica]
MDNGKAGKAIVAGAGIGGLTAAIALQRSGWQVTVLERAPEIAEVGAGLSLWPNAVRALESLGLGATLREHTVEAVSRGGFQTPKGRWLRHKNPADIGVLVAHRAELHRLLLDSLTGDVVRTDATVTGVENGDREVSASYVTAGASQQLTADLLVAADGVNSVVRRALWPEAAAPTFRRRTAWRGVTPPGKVWPVDDCMTIGPGIQFGVLPMTGQRVYWFLTANAEQADRRYDDDRAEVLRSVGDWHDPIPALVEATEPDHVLHNDLVDLDPLPTYVRGRTVLLGDAAHAMTPDLGQGACQAIEDGVVLAYELGKGGDLAGVLAGYDRERRPRTQAIAKEARESNDGRNSQTSAVAHAITGLLLRIIPPGALRKTTARWADWTPPAA